MFYNIKIKTNGSEFALESQNKEITEREMDLYFAKFFGASEEFISKIKEVKISASNLLSINEFDSKSSEISNSLPDDNDSIEHKNDVATKKIILNELFHIASPIEQQQEMANAVDSQSVAEKVSDKIEEIKNAPISTILIQNAPEDDDFVYTRQKLLYQEIKASEANKVQEDITEEENQKRIDAIFSSPISDLDDDIEDAVEQVKQDFQVLDGQNLDAVIDSSFRWSKS